MALFPPYLSLNWSWKMRVYGQIACACGGREVTSFTQENCISRSPGGTKSPKHDVIMTSLNAPWNLNTQSSGGRCLIHLLLSDIPCPHFIRLNGDPTHSRGGIRTRNRLNRMCQIWSQNKGLYFQPYVVHRMRACHAAGPGSIPGRDKFPGWGFFGVFPHL